MQSKEKLSQSEIKSENTFAVFSEIAGSDGISRAEISEKTGLSLMTVGKVADMLTHEGIIIQAKPATGNAGRRAGMLTLSDNHFLMTLDVATRKFRASVSDIGLNVIDSLVYLYNDGLLPEDNIIIFFREACSLLMKHLMTKKLSGIGICVPGTYDAESDTVISPKLRELNGIKIAENCKKAIGISPDRIINSAEAAALSELSSLPDEKRGCTVSLELDSGICGCVTLGGRILARQSDFEALSCRNGKTLGRNTEELTAEEELCAEIGSALRPIISVLCPNCVFIRSSERIFTEWFPTLLSNELKTKNCTPEVFFENNGNSRADIGLAELIVSDMIKKL